MSFIPSYPSQQQTMRPASLYLHEALTIPPAQWKQLFLEDVRQSYHENEAIPPKNSSVVRIMNFNVRMWTTLSDQSNFNEIHTIVARLNPDILILQEVCDWEKTYVTYTAMGYDAHVASCITHNPPFGIAIFAKNSQVINTYATQFHHQRNRSRELCFVRLDLCINNQPLSVYGTHLEVEQLQTGESMEETRAEQLEEIFANSRTLAHKNIIIAGDFNSIREKDYDYEIKPGRRVWNLLTERLSRQYNITINQRVLALFDYYHYRSSFEILSWCGPKYTQWAGGVLDFIFFSPECTAQPLGSYVYYTDISDHLPLIVDLSIATS